MFFKLAINNVKRSYRDYSIYFLTLTFAVCIFYSFNSIAAQGAILEMSKSTADFMSTIEKLIAGTSAFVSLILGGLITYANNFLIRRRKKELGIYMTLGMSKRKISKILIFETMLIGLLSLVIGVLLGIIVSQGLSVITARLLAVEISQYKFIISVNAIMKSAIYFGIIFLLVMVFNQVTISKYKLIDMLNAAKKNEEIKIKNTLSLILTLISSIIILGVAYTMILKIGITSESILVLVAIVLGVLGTLLFLFSLSNFFVYIVQKSKKVYLKDLNIFVLRQVHNKINTNFLSMSVICLMLFLTITLLFTMFGYKSIYDRMLEGNTSFDASSWLIADKDQKEYEIEDYLDSIQFEFESYEKYAFFREYRLNITIADLLSEYLSEQEQIDFKYNYMDGPVSALRISEYNEILQLKGKEPMDLKDNEVLVVSNYGKINNALHDFLKFENSINIDNKAFDIKNNEPIEGNIITTASYLDYFYLIIPDTFKGDLQLETSGFNVVYEAGKSVISEQKFSDLFNQLSSSRYTDGSSMLIFGNTIDQVHARAYGSTATIVFLGIYLGIVFLISSTAVLALQQLSDASDSLERYNSLKKIGASEKIINKAILTQNVIYFMVPMALAIIHSIVGINVVNEIFRTYNQSLIGKSLLMIALTLIIIYGGYFYATYVSFKNIVKHN
jgi:putative ABC transport system permease protein